MKAVIQRVLSVQLKIDGKTFSEIERGLLILLGIAETDTEKECEMLAKKCEGLRIFTDETGKMNLSVNDIKGEYMIVSNFTLYSDCKKGKRPSFIKAAAPEKAEVLYNMFIEKLSKYISINSDARIPSVAQIIPVAQIVPERRIPPVARFVPVARIKTGVFGADMEINLTNDGPVTIIIDTEDL